MKKKKPGKYLKFYETHVVEGRLPETINGGLCSHFGEDPLFQLFAPTNYGWEYEGYSFSNACDLNDRMYEFNENRQNVVLFMAAMNNEL